MLQGKHITFSYSDSAKGKIDVLKDVSFEIREHDFIGLIGTSGSGKTTLIKLLNGLLQPTSGEIKVNGKAPGVDSKKIISYLPPHSSPSFLLYYCITSLIQ